MKTHQTMIHTVTRKELRNIGRQGGWTFWSLCFVLGTIGFFAYLGMQLVPVYAANNNVENALRRSVEGSDLRTISRAEIIKRMDKQLYLDGSHKLLDYKNDLKVQKKRNQFIVQATYERKVPLFFNISVAVDFDSKVECDLNGRCL